MRLLVITAFYPPHQFGGYELRCHDVVEGLRTRGHDIVVVTNRCPDRHCGLHHAELGTYRELHLQSEAVPVWRQVLHDRKDLAFIDRKLRKFSPNVVYLWHVQNLSNALLPYLSHRGFPIVYDEGGSGLVYLRKIQKRGIYFYKNRSDPIYKKWLKAATYAFARVFSRGLIVPEWIWPSHMRLYFNSRSALDCARREGVPVEGARVIHAGIHVGEFPLAERRALEVPVKILVPGRIKREKGTMDAVWLAEELRKVGIQVQIRIVGPIQSQEYFAALQGAIREHELSGVVEWWPPVGRSQLARLYRECDVCFLPTYFKTGFSRVPLEAMASGCLAVSYGNEGSAESILDGKTGFVVGEGDVQSAASTIKRLIDESSEYRVIIQRARAWVEERFAMEAYLGAIEQYLEEQVADSGYPVGAIAKPLA